MADDRLKWKVHTPNLLHEIMGNDLKMGIMFVPINQFRLLLEAVADRASVINDHELNKLMIRLALYSVAEPSSPDYDPRLIDELLSK